MIQILDVSVNVQPAVPQAGLKFSSRQAERIQNNEIRTNPKFRRLHVFIQLTNRTPGLVVFPDAWVRAAPPTL